MNSKIDFQNKIAEKGEEIFLSLSLVLHNPLKRELQKTLETLSQALETFPKEKLRLLIVDNSPKRRFRHKKVKWHGIPTEIISGLGNLGFGKAHNLILENNRLGKFHLVLNPDLWINEGTIQKGIHFLSKNPEFGLCAPILWHNTQQISHLGRDFPDLFSLALRGFAPLCLKRYFSRYLKKYELSHHLSKLRCGKIAEDIPCLSGAFLLMRGEIFKKLNGFDPRFFLYFEDFDFSLRAQKITRTALLPQMIIQHFGGNTGQKGLCHLFYFIRSAYQFYQKHGWHFYKR